MSRFKLEKFLDSADARDEVFALDCITIYGNWGIPDTLTIIDLPGFSLSPLQVNYQILANIHVYLLIVIVKLGCE